MPYLSISNISKSYSSGSRRIEILRDINLDVAEGEFVAIVGYSGSGKTTLMQIVAGLLPPDTGKVFLNGEAVSGPSPTMGLMFQNYSLLPWLNVNGNIDLAIRSSGARFTKAQRSKRIVELLSLVHLHEAGWKFPSQLSGGMKQRVSLARTLGMDPSILLLDEPLSALDALTRRSLQTELEEIWSRDKKTAILITNSVDEAILLADRVVPLTCGPSATLGPSFDVPLQRPRNPLNLNKDSTSRDLNRSITSYLLGSRMKLNQLVWEKGN